MAINNITPMAGMSRMGKGRKLLVFGLVLVVLAGIVWYFASKSKQLFVAGGPKAEVAGSATSESAAGLGGSLYGQIQQNPATKLPNTNPLQNNVNPYKGAYTNPF